MKLPILFLFCLLPFFLLAQEVTPEILKLQGDEYFSNEKYPEALVTLQQYYAIKGADEATILKIAIAAYYSNRLNLATKNLEYLLKNKKSPTADTYLYMGKTLHLQHEFKKAADFYKKFLVVSKDKNRWSAMVKEDIRRCGNGVRMNIPNKTVIVENLGEKVNSIGDEFAPILSPNYQDRLYFSSLRPGNQGGLRNKEGLLDEQKGLYKADMYKTRIVNGEWAATETNEPFLNSPQHDVILDFNSDGSVMYFAKSSNLYSGEIFIDTFAKRDNRGLFPPSFSSPMEMEAGDVAPFFFQDTLMLFSSRRAGGFGGLDLYYTIYKNGAWTRPINLGANINSPYDENFPFLANNGRTLYFSSNNSYKGIGAYDIFKSTFDVKRKEWNLAQNVGLPINSAGNDTHFRLSRDGIRAYFSSHRETSLGERDLYTVYFQSPQQEQLLTNSIPSFKDILEQSEVGDDTEFATSEASNSDISDVTIRTYTFSPLFYDDKNEVLSPRNTKEIDRIINFLEAYPQLSIAFTCHSNQTASPQFDLYYSIKTIEKVVDYMKKNKVNLDRILMKGVGANYPVALPEWNNSPNPVGQALNRRIDINFFNIGDLPIKIVNQPPVVNENIAVTDYKYFSKAIAGLSYKVEIAALKQMYHGNLVVNYPNPMIEKTLNSPFYHYTVGLYQTYTSARQLQQDLIANGVTDAFVVPFIDGIRQEKEKISSFIDVYPDLKQYLSAKLKD